MIVYVPASAYAVFKRVAYRWIWSATFDGWVARVELRRRKDHIEQEEP